MIIITTLKLHLEYLVYEITKYTMSAHNFIDVVNLSRSGGDLHYHGTRRQVTISVSHGSYIFVWAKEK